jgi:hypothetical protein
MLTSSPPGKWRHLNLICRSTSYCLGIAMRRRATTLKGAILGKAPANRRMTAIR